MMEERLQKYMARCGVDSRRKCEELIAQGLVAVNGETVREPGVKIDPQRDRITVDGKQLKTEKLAHYMHYKVKGVTTTVSDDLGRKTVMDCLPDIRERVYPVGRLDKESEGLLLLTNDGALANYLTHPAYGVEKTYRVVAEGRIEEDVLRTLTEKGMRLGPVLVKPSRVELVRHDNDNTIVLISVSEGINREVRRIFAALGHEVKKLLRIRIGPIGLTGMKRGATRALTDKELSLLKKGMEGVDVTEAEAEAMFPRGSAKSRKPTGPRGKPRRAKPERRGKPDPAAGKPGADYWQKGGKANNPNNINRPNNPGALGKPPRSPTGKDKKFSDKKPAALRTNPDKPIRPDKLNRTDRPDRPSRSDRPNRPDRADRPTRTDKPGKTNKPTRAGKPIQQRKPRPPAHPLAGPRSPGKGGHNG